MLPKEKRKHYLLLFSNQYFCINFQEWCQVLQNHQMQEQLGEFQRQSALAAAVQAKTMVSWISCKPSS